MDPTFHGVPVCFHVVLVHLIESVCPIFAPNMDIPPKHLFEPVDNEPNSYGTIVIRSTLRQLSPKWAIRARFVVVAFPCKG